MSAFDLFNYLAIQDPSSAFSLSVTEDIDGTLLERLEYIANRVGAAGKKAQGAGYTSLPAGPTGQVTITANASNNVDGAWAELRSASGNALYVAGIMLHDFSAASVTYNVSIGTGGAGAETVVCGPITITDSATNPTGMYFVPFMYPIEIAASTRVAARCSCDTGGSTAQITLVVMQKTDLVTL